VTLSNPDAVGPPDEVTDEIGYDAFVWATRDASGRAWAAYSHGSGHVTATGEVRLRHADPGEDWSTPTIMTAGSGGYGVGAAGLAAETGEQGGRLWLGLLRYQPTSSVTATGYTTSVRSRDLGSGEWSTPTVLPAAAAGLVWNIGTGLLVCPDGTLLASAYGPPASGGYTVAKVYAYDRLACTWSVLSTVAITGRHAQEPTLVTMADGRLLMLIRSDATPPYYCRLYAAISADGGATWGTGAYVIVVHGSGLPNGYLLPTGEIAVTYRGFTEPRNPAPAYPPRIAMLDANGVATDSGIDVLGGQTARYLYGSLIPGASEGITDWVYSIEGLGGQDGAGAAVYSVPLEWVARSS
jgi:hypothetical protein